MITTDCASSDSKTRDGHRRPRHDCALLFFSTSFTDEQATQGHSPYVFFSCMALVGASLLPDSSSKASMNRAIPSTCCPRVGRYEKQRPSRRTVSQPVIVPSSWCSEGRSVVATAGGRRGGKSAVRARCRSTTATTNKGTAVRLGLLAFAGHASRHGSMLRRGRRPQKTRPPHQAASTLARHGQQRPLRQVELATKLVTHSRGLNINYFLDSSPSSSETENQSLVSLTIDVYSINRSTNRLQY